MIGYSALGEGHHPHVAGGRKGVVLAILGLGERAGVSRLKVQATDVAERYDGLNQSIILCLNNQIDGSISTRSGQWLIVLGENAFLTHFVQDLHGLGHLTSAGQALGLDEIDLGSGHAAAVKVTAQVGIVIGSTRHGADFPATHEVGITLLKAATTILTHLNIVT